MFLVLHVALRINGILHKLIATNNSRTWIERQCFSIISFCIIHLRRKVFDKIYNWFHCADAIDSFRRMLNVYKWNLLIRRRSLSRATHNSFRRFCSFEMDGESSLHEAQLRTALPLSFFWTAMISNLQKSKQKSQNIPRDITSHRAAQHSPAEK